MLTKEQEEMLTKEQEEEKRAAYQEMIDAFYRPMMQEKLDGAWRALHCLSKELDAVGAGSPGYGRLKEAVRVKAAKLDAAVYERFRFLHHTIGCSFLLQSCHTPDKRILSGIFPRYAVKAEDWVGRPTGVAPWID